MTPNNNKRVFIIHRWSAGPTDDWRLWLSVELQKLGYEVFVPEMPDTEIPKIEKWVGHLSQLVGEPDENTFFVGHSIGCQTIMRYLETINKKVGGAVFVAGWFNLDNLEYGDVRDIARPWIETPIDKQKVKQALLKSTLIISDNDSYGYFEENKKAFQEMGSKIVVLHDAGHITDVDGFTELPVILEEL